MTYLNQLDQLANELFAEFGFHSCDREQQEIILRQFMSSELPDLDDQQDEWQLNHESNGYV